MKRENFTYVPSNTKAKNFMKLSALTAARKVNISYKFKHGEGVDVTNKGVVCGETRLHLSQELIDISNKKFSQYESSMNDPWRDRMALLARPLGSEVFLSKETIGDLYGAPEYYMDRLDLEERPNARIRFPYSLAAIDAARKITFMVAQYMEAKHNAARIVQKIYRHYRCMVNFRKVVALAHFAARRIQWFMRKRKYGLQTAKVESMRRHSAALDIQRVARILLAKKMLVRLREERIDMNARRIQKWALKWIQQKKLSRRKQRRLKNCARRLQALYRGYRQRKIVWQYRASAKLIMKCFRLYFIARYSEYIIKIQRCYRRCRTVKIVKMIQRIVRGFVGRRRFIKYRLKLTSDERSRVTKEFLFVKQRLLACAYDDGWCGETSGDVQIITQHMERLDIICTNILNGTLYSKNYPETSKLTTQQKVVYSILFAFSNRPNSCIDCFGIKLAKKYLVPSRWRRNENIYKNLECIPMHSISALVLSNVLEPKYSLQLRLLVKGYLPDILFGEAVLLRRWTKQLNKATFKAIYRNRRSNPPNKFCKRCYEPFAFSAQFRDHAVCHRNHYFSWINKSFLSDVEMVLLHKIDALVKYPKIIRNKKPFYSRVKGDESVKDDDFVQHYIEEEDEDVDYLDELVDSDDEKERRRIDKQKKSNGNKRREDKGQKNLTGGRGGREKKMPPTGPPPQMT